ncbi:MAG: RidA family protein [Steroidobacteraceae bacterium]
MKQTIGLMAVAAVALLGACAPKEKSPAAPAPVVRHSTGDFPIAAAVEVPPGYTIVFHSGVTPSPAKPDAPQGTPEYWGDTQTQAMSVLTKLKESVESKGMTLGDVVSMTVYLAADKTKGADARMDFTGLMAAYTKFFGEAAGQPNLPARSTVEVANLVAPGMLVEIEVTLVRPTK